MRGLWKLTWLDRGFVREPLGFIGEHSRAAAGVHRHGQADWRRQAAPPEAVLPALGVEIPSSAPLIAMSAVLSLITIISIYREGGILKRLRATPLAP